MSENLKIGAHITAGKNLVQAAFIGPKVHSEEDIEKQITRTERDLENAKKKLEAKKRLYESQGYNKFEITQSTQGLKSTMQYYEGVLQNLRYLLSKK